MDTAEHTSSLLLYQRKHCNSCGRDKILTKDFHKNRTSLDGYCVHCKVCSIQRSADFYEKNKIDILKKEKHKRIKKAILRAEEKTALLDTLTECTNCYAVKARKEFRKGWIWPPTFHETCRQCRIQAKNAAQNARQTPEQKVKYKAKKREQRQSNPEQCRQKERKARSESRERRNQLECNRRKENPDQYTGYKLARRTRKRQLPIIWNVSLAQLARQYWHHTCAICGREEGLWYTLAMDHWIPLAAKERCPGTVPWNMLPVCNSKKGFPHDMEPACNQSKQHKDPVAWLVGKLGSRKANAKLREIEAYFDITQERESACLVPSAS
jgi:hypothetical protein